MTAEVQKKIERLVSLIGADGYKPGHEWKGYEVYEFVFYRHSCVGGPWMILVNRVPFRPYGIQAYAQTEQGYIRKDRHCFAKQGTREEGLSRDSSLSAYGYVMHADKARTANIMPIQIHIQ